MIDATQPADTRHGIDPLALPPGILMNGTSVAMFVIAVWRGSERTGDLASILLVAAGWFFVLLGWLLRFVAGAGARTVVSKTVRRWALAPSLFVVAAVLVFGGYAFGARFAISRRALDGAADAALVGDTGRQRWVGLYPVEGISVSGRTVRFDIRGQLGLVRDAPATAFDETAVWYEPIDDRWSLEIDVPISD